MSSTVTSLSVLYPLAQPELPGISTPLLLQQYQLTFREFTRRTESWREELSPVNIVADHDRYALPMPYDVMIRRILWLKTGGTDSDPIDVNEYDLVDGENTVLLEDAPTSALTDGLIVKVVLVPYLFSSELSADYLEKWGEGISAGVKAALMIMKNKTWSDPARASFYANEYLRAQAEARYDNDHLNKTGVLTVHFNEFI